MPHPIRITVNDIELAAELNDSETAQAVYEVLPLEASASRWGEEFYFSIPVDHAAAADARAEMAVGELAYWPPGNAFCIFFGPTPASQQVEPRAANPANPLGRITDAVAPLTAIRGNANVRIEAAE